MKPLLVSLVAVFSMSACSTLTDIFGSSSDQPVDRQLRPSRMDDPALAESMVQALADAGWREEVRALSVVDPDWSVKRHPVSGAITERVIAAEAVTHLSGKSYCRLFSLSFAQPHDGAAYTRTRLHGTGHSWVVDCDKAVATR